MSPSVAWRGKWILTPEFRLLENAYLVCENDRIMRLSRNRPDGTIHDHDGLILPGLVNAHTHLEFSELQQPLGEPGTDFVSWIGLVIKHRNERAAEHCNEIITQGLDESANEGTVALGEISTFDWSRELRPEIHVVDFRELIGFREQQHPDIQDVCKKHLNDGRKFNGEQILAGLSPHAPYSINRQSLDHAIELSRQRLVPLAMHLAESPAEIDLLRNHSGPFFSLLNRLELWTESNFSKGTKPLDFLNRLSHAHRALVIHGNYLSEDEIAFLAGRQETLKLVYCPRTHHFFGHQEYPLENIHKHGVRLALGTDSRASNPDLSIWKEMEFLYSNTKLAISEILKMGTCHGAEALGVDQQLGSLLPGKKAIPYLISKVDDSEFARAIIRDLPKS